jgi:hypothetical protein
VVAAGGVAGHREADGSEESGLGMDDVQDAHEGGDRRKWKLWAIVGGVGTLLILALIIFGLYQLGGDDQSALERLRDISIIFIVLLFFINIVLLAAITAGLGVLIIQIKDQVIPALEELTGTAKRIRGTTNFVTEEAIKPIVSVAGSYAKVRAMSRTVVGKQRKPKI